MESKRTTFGGFASPAPFTSELLSEPTITLPQTSSRAPSRAPSPGIPHFNVTTATERDILMEIWNQIHLIQADIVDLSNEIDDE